VVFSNHADVHGRRLCATMRNAEDKGAMLRTFLINGIRKGPPMGGLDVMHQEGEREVEEGHCGDGFWLKGG